MATESPHALRSINPSGRTLSVTTSPRPSLEGAREATTSSGCTGAPAPRESIRRADGEVSVLDVDKNVFPRAGPGYRMARGAPAVHAQGSRRSGEPDAGEPARRGSAGDILAPREADAGERPRKQRNCRSTICSRYSRDSVSKTRSRRTLITPAEIGADTSSRTSHGASPPIAVILEESPVGQRKETRGSRMTRAFMSISAMLIAGARPVAL